MSAIIKILIVDDEPDICYFLTRSLSKRGFTTSYSHTLVEAEKQLESEQPDILLLDNHLPDGKGIDVVSDVKSRYPDLKIIMISAHDIPQNTFKAYKKGVDFFMPKPFTMSEINQVIDLLLSSNN